MTQSIARSFWNSWACLFSWLEICKMHSVRFFLGFRLLPVILFVLMIPYQYLVVVNRWIDIALHVGCATNDNKCVSKTHIRRTRGAVKTICATPSLPLQPGAPFRRWLCAFVYSRLTVVCYKKLSCCRETARCFVSLKIIQHDTLE